MAKKIEKINPDTAKLTVQEITKESHSLEPSTPIILYEIDISQIKKNLYLGTSLTIPEDYLRFHNMEVLGQQKIYFRGETFHPIPITTEGFELSSGGSLPRPTIAFVSFKGINETAKTKSNFLALKRALLEIDSMIGAKVTRFRTYVKYLDSSNNIPGVGEFTGTNPEFPRDIYFVSRKIEESKRIIKLELSSVLDVENFRLPSRTCLANRCPWNYRGEGCAYEYNASLHDNPLLGDDDKQIELYGTQNHLPKYAPPVAQDNDDLISGFGEPNGDSWVGYDITNAHLRVSGEYDNSTPYPTGAVVYVEKDLVRYYYTSKGNPDNQYGDIMNSPPPNSKYWISDRCSKSIKGCKIRHGGNGSAENDKPGGGREAANKLLPFGGFPGTNSKTKIT